VHETHDLMRAFAGAFLFGIPLLLTMEMWRLGGSTSAPKQMALLVIALGASFLLVRSIGFKRESSFPSHFDQAAHAVAVGLVASLVCLLILNQVRPGDPAFLTAGKLAVQALPLSIGAAVGNAVFKRGKDRHGGESEGPWLRLLHQVGAAATGGAFVGFSVAATEEIGFLAAELTLRHQVALAAFSVALTHAIVFHSGFQPDQRNEAGAGAPDTDRGASALAHVSETATAYATALTVAFAALLFFNQANLADPPSVLAAQTLVLGLPVAIGGAAGRMVL
jgi:putative integral membrane protein (TIGR02587 family)